MAMPGGRLQIHGERTSGQDVRTQNVTAVSAVANIVRTSLGPVGLDKVRRAAWRLMCCGGRAAGHQVLHVLILLPPPLLLQMLVDDIGDVTVTNDGATILKLLEVQHPAAKVRVCCVCCVPACAGRAERGEGTTAGCVHHTPGSSRHRLPRLQGHSTARRAAVTRQQPG
jgi:hypothetical protein